MLLAAFLYGVQSTGHISESRDAERVHTTAGRRHTMQAKYKSSSTLHKGYSSGLEGLASLTRPLKTQNVPPGALCFIARHNSELRRNAEEVCRRDPTSARLFQLRSEKERRTISGNRAGTRQLRQKPDARRERRRFRHPRIRCLVGLPVGAPRDVHAFHLLPRLVVAVPLSELLWDDRAPFAEDSA